MSRIAPLVDGLLGTEDADDLMIEIMDVLGESQESIPEVGKIYVFVYQPKTQGLRYDQNPLVAVTEVLEWGFRGINFHWGESRQYTWSEIAGGLYKVSDDELNDLDGIPFQRFRINN